MPQVSKEKDIINNTLKTRRPVKFLIALAVVFVVSLATLIYFIFSKDIFVVKITVWVMCGLFVVLSGFMLLYVGLTYTEVNSSKIKAHHIFYSRILSISRLDYFIEKNDVYEIYANEKLFTSFDAHDPSAARIISILEKHGVKQHWK